MSTKKERREWILNQIDEVLTEFANEIESNSFFFAEDADPAIVTTQKDRDRLVAELKEIALAAHSGHITFRLGQAKDHRDAGNEPR